MTTIGQGIIKNENTQQQITAVYEFIFQNDSQDGGERVKMKNKEITKKKKKKRQLKIVRGQSVMGLGQKSLLDSMVQDNLSDNLMTIWQKYEGSEEG